MTHTLTPPQTGSLLRFNHQEGDLLIMVLRSGQRVTTDHTVEETESEAFISQAVLQASEDEFLVENTTLSARLRQDEQWLELALEPGEQKIRLLRNGARPGHSGQEPLPLFVFPDRRLNPGDTWNAVVPLRLPGQEDASVHLVCRVVEAVVEGEVQVQMESQPLHFDTPEGASEVRLHGEIRYSPALGCLVHGSLQTEQIGADKHWHSWLVTELHDRIAAHEFGTDSAA